MGPVLFIAFTSDLHNSLPNCKVTAYADDTQILVTGRSLTEIKAKSETAIEQAQKWFTDNSLKINPTKSEVMVFSRKKGPTEVLHITVKEGNQYKSIKTSSSMKILGGNCG